MTTACLSADACPLVKASRCAVKITRALAQNVLATIDAGLVRGLGEPVPGKMCVEAAVCYGLGLPHGDDPGCVATSLRVLQTRLNDAGWSSPIARAQGLRRLGVAQLGSKGVLDEDEFIRRTVRLAITKQVPAAVHALARVHPDPMHQAGLAIAAERCERDGDYASCVVARDLARLAQADGHFRRSHDRSAAAIAFAADHAADAASSAARAAHASQEDAYALTRAAIFIAGCIVYVALAISSSTAFDDTLARFAESIVQILIELQAPGCEWLGSPVAAECRGDLGTLMRGPRPAHSDVSR